MGKKKMLIKGYGNRLMITDRLLFVRMGNRGLQAGNNGDSLDQDTKPAGEPPAVSIESLRGLNGITQIHRAVKADISHLRPWTAANKQDDNEK